MVIFILVVVFFAWRGYRNGLLKSFARVLSLIAGYACAIVFTGPMSAQVESRFDLQGIAAFITASAILFIGASSAVMLLFWLIQKLLVKRETPTTASAIGGAAVGSLVGLLLAVIIVWGFGFVRGMSTVEAPGSVAQTRPGGIEGLANRVASKAVDSALSLGSVNPEVARLSAALVESPGEIAQRSQRLMQSEALTRLLGDPANRNILDSGDYAAVEQLPAFQQLLRDQDLQALMVSTGMAQEAQANNRSVDAELARQFTDIWQRAQRVKNDQRVQAILSDPEFQRKIQSGNPLDLLSNARLLELADIMFEDSDAPTNNGGQPAADKEPTQVYSWTDSSGRIHYSDKKPESGAAE